MNAVTPNPRTDGSRLQGVLAYVSDADSEAMLNRVAVQLALPNFEVRRGDIRAAERDLKTQRSPAVLFVDVSDIDTVLDAVQSLSEVCEPQLQVAVIGSRNDVGLYRSLAGLGAAEYLFKPLTAELVETVMWRLTTGASRTGDGRLGKLVAVTGARGGVGASSIAANLATYLADKASRRVVLVDLDTRNGAQALLVNAKPNAGLAEALEAPGRIDDLFLERATIAVAPRLDLLASEMPVNRQPVVTIEACETLLTRLRRSYHYVVIDLTGARELHEPLLAAANLQLLVVEATLLAVRDAARRLDTSTAAGQRAVVVHNKAGRPGDLTAEDFASALRRAPDAVVPYLPKVFGSGINLGKPAWQSDARVETAIALLARELSGQATRTAAPPLYKRLLGLK